MKTALEWAKQLIGTAKFGGAFTASGAIENFVRAIRAKQREAIAAELRKEYTEAAIKGAKLAIKERE